MYCQSFLFGIKRMGRIPSDRISPGINWNKNMQLAMRKDK